jgi:hypothetical protein
MNISNIIITTEEWKEHFQKLFMNMSKDLEKASDDIEEKE